MLDGCQCVFVNRERESEVFKTPLARTQAGNL